MSEPKFKINEKVIITIEGVICNVNVKQDVEVYVKGINGYCKSQGTISFYYDLIDSKIKPYAAPYKTVKIDVPEKDIRKVKNEKE
jgi:hypothetical protein